MREPGDALQSGVACSPLALPSALGAHEALLYSCAEG